MGKAETIANAIKKKVSEFSLTEWLNSCGISEKEFDSAMESIKMEAVRNAEKYRWHEYPGELPEIGDEGISDVLCKVIMHGTDIYGEGFEYYGYVVLEYNLLTNAFMFDNGTTCHEVVKWKYIDDEESEE